MNFEDNVCVTFVAELDKSLGRCDVELLKCIEYCKASFMERVASSSTPFDISASYFHLAGQLVQLFDERTLAFQQDVQLARKLQAMRACVHSSLDYARYCFATATTQTSSESDDETHETPFVFSQDELNTPLKVYISELIVHMCVGLPVVLIGDVLGELSANDLQQQQHFRPSDHLTLSQAAQNDKFNFMLNQKIIAHQLNDYYFTAFQQLVANYDVAWTSYYSSV